MPCPLLLCVSGRRGEESSEIQGGCHQHTEKEHEMENFSEGGCQRHRDQNKPKQVKDHGNQCKLASLAHLHIPSPIITAVRGRCGVWVFTSYPEQIPPFVACSHGGRRVGDGFCLRRPRAAPPLCACIHHREESALKN